MLCNVEEVEPCFPHIQIHLTASLTDTYSLYYKLHQPAVCSLTMHEGKDTPRLFNGEPSVTLWIIIHPEGFICNMKN